MGLALVLNRKSFRDERARGHEVSIHPAVRFRAGVFTPHLAIGYWLSAMLSARSAFGHSR
jgi:hypothetical protein